jgi:hypothetical protein
MIGRYIKGVMVSPVVRAVDGSFTVNTGTDLGSGGFFDGMTVSAETELERIVATNAFVDNQAITLDSFTVTVNEIKGITGTSALWALFGGFDYFRVSCTIQAPGEASVTNTFAAVLTRSTCEDEYAAGKNTVKLTGRPCGVAIYFGTGTPPF